MTKYIIYSPDNFTIDYNFQYYTSKKKAMKAFDEWKKRYFLQGYYSSSQYGKISINELQNYCLFKIEKY